MKTIGPFARDLQKEIKLGWCQHFQFVVLSSKKHNSPNSFRHITGNNETKSPGNETIGTLLERIG
jgi:hypothetical protein